jgi:peroxiredoxin
MSRLALHIWLAVISVSVLTLFCSLSLAVSAAVKDPKARSTAPDFSLPDAAGAAVKLSDFRGKVVLLNFWAASCEPCNIEIPWFNEFLKSYGERGFAVLAIAMDEGGWTVVKPYIPKNNIRYKVLLGNELTAKAYGGVQALPTSFLIDRDGKIAARHIGISGQSVLEEDIRKLLEQ